MNRVARNLDDLPTLVRRLTRRGVGVEFIKEQLEFTGEDSHVQPHALGDSCFRGVRALLIREWQRGRYRVGQTARRLQGAEKTLTREQAAELVQGAGSGAAQFVFASDYGIKRGYGLAPLIALGS